VVAGRTVWLVAPYALWMALMAMLPSTTLAYAVRTAVVASLLVASLWRLRAAEWVRVRFRWRDMALGVAVGLAVFAVWILPEQFDCAAYRKFCIVGEGGTTAVADSDPALLAMRLAGSAFVISVAEELFFRKWLVGFAGFWWMVALFAVEHDRWLVGAVAGIAYGLLALRRGLGAAVVAHVVTNLVLGLWVLKSGQWQFW